MKISGFFSSPIKIIGINPYVYLPEEVLNSIFKQANKDKGPIPVRGKLNGKSYKQTLVKYQGAWRLYLNGPMLKAAELGVGDIAKVQIEFDPVSREVAMHPKLKALLVKNKKANAAFQKLTPYRKKEILRYLKTIKTEETLNRSLKKVIDHLMGKKVEGLIVLTYKK